MDRKSTESFIQRNKHCDHGHVVWSDGSENEFGLTLRVENLLEYPTPFDCLVATVLSWYPERKKEEIRSIRIAG